jgi:hypothetical protein
MEFRDPDHDNQTIPEQPTGNEENVNPDISPGKKHKRFPRTDVMTPYYQRRAVSPSQNELRTMRQS